jgi:hypothetical protein
MSETLTEKVARAIMDITSCDLVSAPGRCLVDRAGSCYCREEARAAIAVVIEECAKVADDWQAQLLRGEEVHHACSRLAAAIRRLAE